MTTQITEYGKPASANTRVPRIVRAVVAFPARSSLFRLSMPGPSMLTPISKS
nr:hypothetical protein [Micromonospora sp. 4G51]